MLNVKYSQLSIGVKKGIGGIWVKKGTRVTRHENMEVRIYGLDELDKETFHLTNQK